MVKIPDTVVPTDIKRMKVLATLARTLPHRDPPARAVEVSRRTRANGDGTAAVAASKTYPTLTSRAVLAALTAETRPARFGRWAPRAHTRCEGVNDPPPTYIRPARLCGPHGTAADSFR
ncbi:hypothetical protein NPX13_g4900 [Xylaria arbuscula]|uniref:Uncharacterized protein n=1 Tax=Xylaria arbuscula TaxID=114810 RepID=A0A9W8NEZ5_9PEZI|nr:hypothetical protein NPX13_g4900 [Xylaria arbuscula]